MRSAIFLLLVCVACDLGRRTDTRTEIPPAPPPQARPAEPTVDAPRAPRTSGKLREHAWDYAAGPFGPTRVVVAVPEDASSDRRSPVLVAFHGRGEALKGRARGARGWLDDYGLHVATARLAEGKLDAKDFHGFITEGRLEALRLRLDETPYQGLIVVCPYLPPDVLRGESAFERGGELADFIADVLLPRVYAELPAERRAAVDGVSLGGRAALLVGLLRPEAFESVGALQPAVDDAERPRFTSLAREARRRRPSLTLRLLTSDGDYFLDATRNLAQAMRDAHVEVELDVVTGPHTYAFNRGPGVFEMLLHHDARLRR
jgi:iron(III)-salmochelin esterase